MDREWLVNYGIDYDKGLKNCMGDIAFYKKILSMFLTDQCFAQAQGAYAEGNQKELFSRMHELKGISGNAALTALYETTVPLVELLRVGNGGGADAAEVARLFAAAEREYYRACEGVSLLVAQQ